MGTIIVTGSSGFIGGNLINFLNKKNIETFGISRRESPYNTNVFNIKYIDLTVDENIDLLYEIKNVYALVHC
nr:NAD-dependent epimerase/dehydratase family protein [Providencia stuartii]